MTRNNGMNGWQEYLSYLEGGGGPATDSLMIPRLVVQCWTEEDASIVEFIEEFELLIVELSISSCHAWRYDFFPQSFLDFKSGPGREHFWVMSPNYYLRYVKDTVINRY